MLRADEPNIREVVAFHMRQKAEDPMMNALASAAPKQLRERSIRVVDGRQRVNPPALPSWCQRKRASRAS
jgi:aspartyl-tRNA synthetase